MTWGKCSKLLYSTLPSDTFPMFFFSLLSISRAYPKTNAKILIFYSIKPRSTWILIDRAQWIKQKVREKDRADTMVFLGRLSLPDGDRGGCVAFMYSLFVCLSVSTVSILTYDKQTVLDIWTSVSQQNLQSLAFLHRKMSLPRWR